MTLLLVLRDDEVCGMLDIIPEVFIGADAKDVMHILHSCDTAHSVLYKESGVDRIHLIDDDINATIVFDENEECVRIDYCV